MSREAMKQALDMLNEIADDVYCDQKLEGVITALRKALVDANDTSQERVDEKAKREQEPVAWISEGGDVSRSKRYMDEMGFKCNPLYTAPPKREWVGLTDEEISDLWCKVSNTDFVTIDTHEFARAIEAKLKEKNT